MTRDRTSIIVLRQARRRMRIVLSRCDVTWSDLMSQGRLTLWRHSALRCDVTPRYAVTWLFTRKTPIYKTYTCQYSTSQSMSSWQTLTVVECEWECDWPLDPLVVQFWRTQGPEKPIGLINGGSPLQFSTSMLTGQEDGITHTCILNRNMKWPWQLN